MDVELVARNSFSSLQKIADENFVVSPENLEDWNWSNLRKQFKNKNLERLYSIYHGKLENGYMSLFILLQLFLGTVHCLILYLLTWEIKDIVVDLITNGFINALILPIIAFTFRSDMIARETHLPVFISCLVIGLLVIGDSTIVIYYTLNCSKEFMTFRPANSTLTMIVCYLLLPLSNNFQAFILGITASVCYLAGLSLITYKNDPEHDTKMLIEVVYYLCINCLGLYFRFMNEIMIRRSFLDHRKYIESTLRLNYEKDQEEQLTGSILPPHFAAKIKTNFCDISKFMEEHKKPPASNRFSAMKDLYIEKHENVSILYADVVNFSGLTVTLPVKKLVETLNNLFGNFDEASERHNVLRIKFLGDCYYCISGVPVPNVKHAKSCVDLGLDMIIIINDIRAKVQEECGVDVNMRIGVHSGKIFSGIIGINKWQFDVWSRDVIIANKMEQTGEAGKVHVTQQTLDLLDVEMYNWEVSSKSNDECLKMYGIFKSYLITPTVAHSNLLMSLRNPCSTLTKEYAVIPSCLNMNKTIINKTFICPTDAFACSFRRRTHFMDACLHDYHLMLKAADAEMEKAIEKMPLTKLEQWRNWDSINPLSLTFYKWKWELPYLQEPDPLFKFYVICTTMVMIFASLILFIPFDKKFQHYFSSGLAIFGYITTFLFILFLIPITWTQFLCHLICDSSRRPKNKILKFFYETSIKIVWNEVVRIVLFFIIISITSINIVFNLMLDCTSKPKNLKSNVTYTLSSEVEMTSIQCILTPWQLTQNCILAIVTVFAFLKIHFLLKLLAAIFITSLYAWNIWWNRSFMFQTSHETWNPNFDKRLTHILTLIYLTFSLHVIDRQSEYLNRLDYQWKRQLIKEQNEALHTRNANKLLLRNILPEHVAEFYLNMDRSECNTLYHEIHKNVAVMFATLTDLSIDESNTLVDFNEIICQFDKLLFKPEFICKIEKIKLAGTTYMAACGLETSRRVTYHQNISINMQEKDYNEVQIIVQFATEMIKVLSSVEVQTEKPYKLRVGVSHGEVTAGVVGAQKPLYDIWGDAVNMASRMDTTGVPGKIQVTKATAKILMKEGIKCHERGEVWVKPKGYFTTYFVTAD